VANDFVVIHEPNTNSVKYADRRLNVINQIPGNYEAGIVVEDFHHYKHSVDDVYMLWNKGQDDIGIVDLEEIKCIEVI
jgi:hypothetical protein